MSNIDRLVTAFLGALVTLPLAISPAFAQKVDPESALTPESDLISRTERNFSTEWNTPGDTKNWEVLGWSIMPTESGLTLTSSSQESGDAVVQIKKISDGPRLDLGYNDFVDVEIELPISFDNRKQGLDLLFGVTDAGTPNQSGFSPSRQISFPKNLLKTGLHTYRFDMGLAPMWRGTLTDLRITLRGVLPGQKFSFKKVVVGDESGNLYTRRDSKLFPAPLPDDFFTAESKHFRLKYSITGYWLPDGSFYRPHRDDKAKRGTLRNLEECWQVYQKKLGFKEPCYPIESGSVSGGALKKYKINVNVSDEGAFAKFENDVTHGGKFAWMNLFPKALQVDPPGWVLPHELMHVFQFHNQRLDSSPTHNWSEAHAEYGMERWLEHYSLLFPEQKRSALTAFALSESNLGISPGRSIYETWPLFYYLETNPDKLLGLGEGTIAKIWQKVGANTSPYTTLGEVIKGSGLRPSVKDILGFYARRMVTLDFPGRQGAMQSAVGSALQKSYTELERVPDNPDWWRCPQEKAPLQGGYTIHPITPTTTQVAVEFRGLENRKRNADWRAAIVVVKTTGRNIGSAQYSPLWRQGEMSMRVETTDKVYLVVAATPDEFFLSDWDESAFPYRSHPSKERFHYEVKITGGNPTESTNGVTTQLSVHSNGGGLKSNTATVASTAFVGPGARVLGYSQVLGNARIEGNAIVKDHAIVTDNAIVSGHSLVGESAAVNGQARVRDRAQVIGNAVISDNARILQSAIVSGDTRFKEVANARGMSIVTRGRLSGGATLDGDFNGNITSGKGFAFGYNFGGEDENFPPEWIQDAPDRILAAYDFDESHDTSAIDSHGSLTAFVRGAPVWSTSDGTRQGFLTFNGSNQWVALDRALADVRDFSFTAWIKPLGGRNQAVLWMGSSPTRRMVFTPSDERGYAVFAIRNGGQDLKLTARPLPTGVWSHVAITLDGTKGNLYVNGKCVATGSIRIRPDELLAGNDLSSIQENYLARSSLSIARSPSFMPMFHGCLDKVEFYAKALTSSEILNKADSSATQVK